MTCSPVCLGQKMHNLLLTYFENKPCDTAMRLNLYFLIEIGSLKLRHTYESNTCHYLHCIKSVGIPSYSGTYFPAFG